MDKNIGFTPGPWGIGGSVIYKENQPLLVVLHNPAPLWTGNKTPRDVDYLAPSLGEADANARLIAAAPELLDALCELVIATPNDGPVVKKAQVAIAKAAGRT